MYSVVRDTKIHKDEKKSVGQKPQQQNENKRHCDVFLFAIANFGVCQLTCLIFSTFFLLAIFAAIPTLSGFHSTFGYKSDASCETVIGIESISRVNRAHAQLISDKSAQFEAVRSQCCRRFSCKCVYFAPDFWREILNSVQALPFEL